MGIQSVQLSAPMTVNAAPAMAANTFRISIRLLFFFIRHRELEVINRYHRRGSSHHRQNLSCYRYPNRSHCQRQLRSQ